VTSVDVAVIGRGLIGSAAARHLAESGVSTALIGPDEPADRTTSPGPFSSHADESRITRIAASNTVWSTLAARSITRYGDIIRRSEIGFHASRGLVVIRPDLDEWIDSGLVTGSNIRKVDPGWLRDTTGITVDNGLPAAFEGGAAGYIQPRRLVTAQTKLAARAGATVVPHAVDAVGPIPGGYEVTGGWGSISADRILVATGAFGRHLLAGDLQLERMPRTVVAAEMDDGGVLPSLIMGEPPDKRLTALYWVPPVRYPDGRLRLKVGGTLATSPVAGSEADLVEWFHGDGDPVEVEALVDSVRSLLPGLAVASVTPSPCVTTNTPSGFPYIGWVGDGVAVAIGGNGEAAKSSDEIGRLAASLFSAEGWTDSLDTAIFTPQLI
jgi:sarcosine oxidase